MVRPPTVCFKWDAARGDKSGFDEEGGEDEDEVWRVVVGKAEGIAIAAVDDDDVV